MKKFKHWDKMIEDIESNYNWWDKFISSPKMNWLRWTIYNLPDVPRDIYSNIKWFIQRGKKGYSNRDCWDLDNYLSEIIVNGVTQLKNETLHSIDKKILDNIIYTFEVEKKIINNDWIYINKPTIQDKKVAKKCHMHLMTEKECQRYNKGWSLFKKHFKRLWD